MPSLPPRSELTVTHSDAIALIREADVMICVSLDETGPLTLIEAMALRKAVLTTRVGVVGEKLIPEKEALFVEPGDAVGLAAAIERLVRDPELLRKLATDARKAYEKNFGLERFGKEFLGIVEEAIQNESSLREKQHRSFGDPGVDLTIQPSEQQGKELQNFARR